jgi:hypothetical protein
MQEEVYENPNKTQDNAIKKPSRLWYLLPLLLGLIGGLVGYFELKAKDRKMAKRILIVGIVITMLPVITVLFGVIAYYGVFAPSSFVAPAAKGFTEVQVTNPWQVTSQGGITMNVQNRAPMMVVLREISVSKGQTGSGKCVLQSGGISIQQGETRLINCDIQEISGSAGSPYILGLALNFSADRAYFISSGTITGTYQ